MKRWFLISIVMLLLAVPAVGWAEETPAPSEEPVSAEETPSPSARLAAMTGADPMLMVTVTTTAFLAGVIRKPLLVLAVLFLCFPVAGLFWMGLAAIIGSALPIPAILLPLNSEVDNG